jgi:hypothetical protein
VGGCGPDVRSNEDEVYILNVICDMLICCNEQGTTTDYIREVSVLLRLFTSIHVQSGSDNGLPVFTLAMR